MCGIVGVGSIYPQFNREWLSFANDTQIHRGPDSGGEWWSLDGQVGFAHRRLAVNDLSSAGNQPMHDQSGKITLIFNGEIYNFREIREHLFKGGNSFHSMTDTEVLIAAYKAWGLECLSKLNGAFSFALYDLDKKILFFARDRAGEKPLFYHYKHGLIYFSSELKALFSNLALDKSINLGGLNKYLEIGFVPGDDCIVKGFNKLPPANAMIFNLTTGEKKIWQYWDIPKFVDSNLSDEEFLIKLEVLLGESIKRQLDADVPVGILLSGGVDSSLITAIAAQQSINIKTFTIGFQGQLDLDETKYANLIANYFGTEHTILNVDSESVDLLPILAKQFDEPIVDSSMIPTFLVSKLVGSYCKVAIGGDGADELFGGYEHYSRMLWVEKWLSKSPQLIRNSLGLFAKNFLEVGIRGRNWLQNLAIDWERGVPSIANYFDPNIRDQLIKSRFIENSFVSDCLNYDQTLLQRATRSDFKGYLAEDILVKVDRSSMLNSLEIRAPFLDHRLIEYAFGQVPDRLKSTTTDKKILLKSLATKILPKQFNLRRKQGFSIPLNRWLKNGPYKDLFMDTLICSNSLFDQDLIKKIFDGQMRGHNNGERLFALVLFELWRKEYQISF